MDEEVVVSFTELLFPPSLIVCDARDDWGDGDAAMWHSVEASENQKMYVLKAGFVVRTFLSFYIVKMMNGRGMNREERSCKPHLVHWQFHATVTFWLVCGTRKLQEQKQNTKRIKKTKWLKCWLM